MAKNIVLIGGGTGTSALIKGIKNIDDINLSVIVTVADSGGSTGKIRREFSIPAIGDIRQVLISLSNNENLLMELMRYRFKKRKTKKIKKNHLATHSLGNLIITALIDIEHGFYQGIKYLSNVFNIKGEIVPVTDESVELKAEYTDGSVQVKEHLIPNKKKKIARISYIDETFKVNPRAIEVIKNADYIIFGCGSLYTSLIANLCVPDIKKAINNNKKAKVVYFCNLATQPKETNNMSALDHIQAIEDHLGTNRIDSVIINNKKVDDYLFNKYKKSNQDFLFPDKQLLQLDKEIIQANLIDDLNRDLIRHDVKKITEIVKKIIKE